MDDEHFHMTCTDCRSDIGVTTGLVDSLIFICRVLAKRDLKSFAVQAALQDLISDEDFNAVIKGVINE